MRNSTRNPRLSLANVVKATDSAAAFNPHYDKYHDIRREFYGDVARELGITETVWSVFHVDDFNAVAYPDAEVVAYDRPSGWGKHCEERIPKNSTWAHLWVVASRLIKRSGDNAHVFIESFDWSPSTKRLVIVTGS